MHFEQDVVDTEADMKAVFVVAVVAVAVEMFD